jgi:hypothetical protein
MSDPTCINPQIYDVINVLNHATMDPQTVLTSGRGKAYQSVAQSAAIAIQDATDALRNVSTIATTAAGVALAELVATGNPEYVTVMQQAQALMTSAASDFTAVSEAATQVVKQFPSG